MDDYKNAPQELKEYATALNIVKTIISVHEPLSQRAIEIGLKKAKEAGYDLDILEEEIEKLVEKLR